MLLLKHMYLFILDLLWKVLQHTYIAKHILKKEQLIASIYFHAPV